VPEVTVSRPDKVLFPEDGITKADLVDYYRSVAPAMLPHLLDRPLTIQRFPDGIHGPTFFQKNTPAYFPEWIRRVELPKEGGTVRYMLIDDADGLAYVAAQAGITFHIASRPDEAVWDLDPSGPDDFDLVRRTALRLHDLLSERGLESFVKTTGSRGLHVLARLSGSDGAGMASSVAADLAATDPDNLTTEFSKSKRHGRLYLDIARNGYAQTTVAPYSVRARPGAPVSAPLAWDEVRSEGLTPQAWTLRSVPARLAGQRDPWAPLGSS
jgi:bifunctional non-homologous end joining protein LigD